MLYLDATELHAAQLVPNHIEWSAKWPTQAPPAEVCTDRMWEDCVGRHLREHAGASVVHLQFNQVPRLGVPDIHRVWLRLDNATALPGLLGMGQPFQAVLDFLFRPSERPPSQGIHTVTTRPLQVT